MFTLKVFVSAQLGRIQEEFNKYVAGYDHHQEYPQQGGDDTVEEKPRGVKGGEVRQGWSNPINTIIFSPCSFLG